MSPAKANTPRLTNAQRDLVNQWTPLCAKLAIEWARKGKLPHYEVDDLIQEAVLGAMLAATTYDASKGASFPTWCAVNVRHSLREATRKRHLVRGRNVKGQYLESAGPEPLGFMTAPPVDVDRNLDAEHAWAALAEFNPRERDQRGLEIFKLRSFADGKPPTQEEAGAQFGLRSRQRAQQLEMRGKEAFERFAAQFRGDE